MSTFFLPQYRDRATPTVFKLDALPQNPIEIAPQPFHRLPGKQFIDLTDLSTGFTATARFDGGYIDNTGGFRIANISNFFLLKGTEVECTVTMLSTNVYQFNTTDGRTYVITFSPLSGVRPTIQKTGGAGLAGDFSVTIRDIFVRSDQTFSKQ